MSHLPQATTNYCPRLCHNGIAVFADDHDEHEHSIDLLGVNNTVKTLTLGATKALTFVDKKLYVAFFADEGSHTLLINHENSDWNQRADLLILPEHGESFVQLVSGSFPVLVRPDPAMNVYSLLLDGQPLGKAYLVSESL